ncbi:cytochrome P450 family protein [Mycobacterium xenopi 3993]|nr:cytochrome P450 family protein [Mycobacterium xenopi 3993]
MVLSRLSDIEMALKHTELFSSNMDAVDLGNLRPLIPLQIDPPEHAKYRRILDPLFTPREMARREPEVTKLVNEMIDGFADRGECDFHAEFAVPLPCTVFLQLLGLPLEDLDKFLAWKDGVIRPRGCGLRKARAGGRTRGPADLRLLRAGHRRPHRPSA